MSKAWHYYIDSFFFHKGRLYVDPHRASYGTEHTVNVGDTISGECGTYTVLRQPLEIEIFVEVPEAKQNGIIRELI